jgi:hypothetical protein
VSDAERLNADAHAACLNPAALQAALKVQGDAWYELVSGRCPHLFADVPVFISHAQLQQMTDVIGAVERVVNNEQWMRDIPLPNPLPQAGEGTNVACSAPKNSFGVFYGYDFHLNSDGAHLIEINTNAGGAFLNALLNESQREVELPGEAVGMAGLEQAYLEMFRREWRQAAGDVPLSCIAIVDEKPDEQYLYPEFLLAQRLFERAGIRAHIAEPSDLQARDDGLYVGEQKVDLVYNRLTDFSLQQYPVLLNAWSYGRVVLTPDPVHYACYADKRNLARLTDADELQKIGVSDADIATLQAGIPHTFAVRAALGESLWDQRKNLFFKPNSGFGSRGAYRGEKLTRRVFGEILQSDYVAQKLATPGERSVDDGVSLKYDIRCYVYDGEIQLVAARLYQGQTTNFRTAGGGFAQVRMLG